MKKAILSVLCSALVVPGLGQIINQHLKKGLCILFAVFILFITAVVNLSRIINTILEEKEINQFNHRAIMDRLGAEDSSVLRYLLVAFAILWLYSVLDAYLAGKKIDQRREKERL